MTRRTHAMIGVVVAAIVVGATVYALTRSPAPAVRVAPPRAVPAAPSRPGPVELEWTTLGARFRSMQGANLRVICPPNGTPGVVLGSGPYADESTICTAAVHAGEATLASGGTFVLVVMPGQRDYVGSARNDITTSPLGLSGGAFRIAHDTPGP